MNAVRIHRQIESETLHLPELKPFVGKAVEIIVLEETVANSQPIETKETFFGLAPEEKPVSAEEYAMLLEEAKEDPALAAFLEVARQDILDVDAIIQTRAESIK